MRVPCVACMSFIMATLTAQHVIIGIVCNGVDVWRRLGATFAFVGGHNGRRVHRQPFVWIHRHTEKSRVGLRKHDATLIHFIQFCMVDKLCF